MGVFSSRLGYLSTLMLPSGSYSLGGVEQHLVPVHGIGLGRTHGGQQHAARVSLTVDVLDYVFGVVCAGLEAVIGLDDLERVRGAERDATVAVDALGVVHVEHVALLVVLMHLVGALADTDLALDATVLVPDHFVIGLKIVYHCLPPSFSSSTMTGSPPAGLQILSGSGQMERMAHSSLATYVTSPRSAATMLRSFRRSLSAIMPPV